MRKTRLRCVLAFLLATFCAPGITALAISVTAAPAAAQTTAAVHDDGTAALAAQVAALEQQTKAAQSNADNGWMLVCAALVLLMTAPGLALFYGGLVRQKNVLATMMQSFAMMALITVVWALVSFSLAFAPGTSFIGGLKYMFLRGVGSAPNPAYAGTLPFGTFMVYQLMFAIITPALISGAFAERMKFSAMALFLTLWSICVYSPMAHMVWGVGGLLNAAGGLFPTLDFAGGTVVHVTSGVSALVCCLYLGRRLGHGEEPMTPHSMVLSFIGAALLWVGWFGFNAGSALASGSLATSAFVATQFGAAAAAMGWVAAEWLRGGKPTALGAISGAVAGLVAITPASGFVGPMPALAIGAAAGVVCYLMVTVVKSAFGYDDSLDAFGVHGAGGMLGAILTGVFASSAINPIFHNASGGVLASGWLEGNARQMLNQAAGVAVACLLAGVGTFLLLKLVDATVGLRVSEEHEAQGLDVTQHGEEGYVWEPVLAVATPLPAPLAPALPLRLSVSPHRNLVATPMVEPELAGINPLARRQPGTGLSRRRLGRRPRAPRPLTRVNGREFQTEADRIAPDPLHWL